jgi:hypothetical protein
MAIPIWFCTRCEVGVASPRKPAHECPQCGEEPLWTKTPPYKLTLNDRRLLRSLRIDPEDPGAD